MRIIPDNGPSTYADNIRVTPTKSQYSKLHVLSPGNNIEGHCFGHMYYDNSHHIFVMFALVKSLEDARDNVEIRVVLLITAAMVMLDVDGLMESLVSPR
jgi:hypothetical protein